MFLLREFLSISLIPCGVRFPVLKLFHLQNATGAVARSGRRAQSQVNLQETKIFK